MIEIKVKDFTKAARTVGAVIERRNTIPVLGTMRARANGRLELTGTDLDSVVTASIPCDSQGEHAEFILSDHRALMSAIGAAGGETFKIDVKDKGYITHAGQLRRDTKHTPPVDDWPVDHSTPNDVTFTACLPASALRELERISAAISTEETRYYLNGIHMKKLDGWTYRFAATDGHRLMLVDIQLPDAIETFDGREVIFPRKFLAQIFANFRKSYRPVVLNIGTGAVVNSPPRSTAPTSTGAPRVSLSGTVGNMDIVMSGKTIDGKYPDYARVFPTDVRYQAIVNVAKLRQAILAVSASVYSSITKPVRLEVTSPDGLRVSASFDIDVASTSTFDVECKHNCPDGFYIGFNANYLLDMLAAIRGDEVRLGLTDASSPMTIHDTSDTAFMAIQMPMRV